MTVERKQEIIKTYRRDEKDTGSPEVQIALLTERINELTEHLKVHKKFKNKTLASLAIPLVFSCIILGVCCSVNIGYEFNVGVVLIVFLIQYIARGPFYPLIKQYLNNFTTATLRTKISSSFNLLENILRFLITFAASNLLRVTTTANTFTILGCVLAIIVVLMLDNMRKKVGLKPEQYSERDTKIMELK